LKRRSGSTQHSTSALSERSSDDDDDDNSIQFFIYLRAELNSWGPITESALNMKTNNNTTTKQNTHKEDKTKNTNTKKKNKDKAKNANANKIIISLKEIKTTYVLNSAASGQLQSQYGT
jgi:hypothetical protein